MKRLSIVLAVLVMGLPVQCAPKEEGKKEEAKKETASLTAPQDLVKPAAPEEKISYIVGFNVGRNLKNDDLQVSVNYVIKGLQDAMGGAPGMLTDQEMQETMQTFQQSIGEKRQAKAAMAATKNKTDGDAFLAENKKRKEVTTLADGLQYEVLTEGTGPKPKETDTVKVNYKGTLIDGTQFDSSYDRGEPAVFPVKGVIKGWQEGIPLMTVGSKYKFFIPAELGYGDRGAGGTIGPNATLIFEVELLGIEPPKTAEPQKPAQPQTGAPK